MKSELKSEQETIVDQGQAREIMEAAVEQVFGKPHLVCPAPCGTRIKWNLVKPRGPGGYILSNDGQSEIGVIEVEVQIGAIMKQFPRGPGDMTEYDQADLESALAAEVDKVMKISGTEVRADVLTFNHRDPSHLNVRVFPGGARESNKHLGNKPPGLSLWQEIFRAVSTYAVPQARY